MSVEIRRGSDRFVDRQPGRITHHAFSFGPHYDPDRLAFGPLVCHDDHLLGRGEGFEPHRHSALDIVTWVAQGTLVHTDSSGAAVRLGAGSVAHLASRGGVEHSELASDDGPVRFVQVWLRSDDDADADAAPAYEVVEPTLVAGRLTPVLTVGEARLSIAALAAGATLTLPASSATLPRLHVYVASGALLRSSLAEPLSAGDAFLMAEEPGHRVTAAVDTQLLVWQLP